MLSLAVILATVATASGDPAFVMLDRQSQTSEAGLETSDILLPKTPGSQFYAIRVELHAQYTDPGSGLGGYARLPIGWAWGDCMYCASGSAIGDLELGALYARDVSPGFAIVGHAGLALPTAPIDQFVLDEMIVPRIQDLALEVPKGTTLRFGLSPIIRSGRVSARVDLGIDFNLSDAIGVPDIGPVDEPLGAIFHVGGGVGIDVSRVTVSGELELAGAFHSSSTMDSPRMTAALGVRMHFTRFRTYAAVVVPVSDGDTSFRAVVTAGLDVSLFSPSASQSIPPTSAAP
jgi:hypothetical protein